MIKNRINFLLHALCWIHAERTIHKLIGCSEEERKAIKDVRDRIWQLYRNLKAYKEINLLFISRRAAESAERVRQIASKIFPHG